MKEEDLIAFLQRRMPDLTKTDQFNRTDCYSNEWDLIVEMKSRTEHYNDILIEKDKYDALMASDKKNKRYIVSTPKGIYSFDIEKVKFVNDEWYLKLLPETTFFKEKPNYIYKWANTMDIKYAKVLHKF